jgi:crotonobetainyl-CoA:carnitine CoA-transferase CaiB-like acyl-CoA transferase
MMGAVVGASSIIAALLHRKRTGEGQAVELAMYDVATWLTAEAWPVLMSGNVPEPIGCRSRSIHWQGVFATRDGYVALAAASATHRRALQSMVTQSGDCHNDDELTAGARSWCAARTTTEVVALGRHAGVVAAPVLSVNDVAVHPQFVDRGIVVEMNDCRGRRGPTLGSAFRMTQTPGVSHGFAEPLGASTEQILAELKVRKSGPRANRA